MRALLIAGLRLASGAPVASLRVGGLTLLERAVLVARDAGATAALVLAERRLQATLRQAVARPDLGVELTFADPATERDTILGWVAGDDPIAVIRADVAHTRHASAAMRDADVGEVLVDQREEPSPGAERLRLAGGATWVGLAILRGDRLADLVDGVGRDPTRGDLVALDAEVAGRYAQTIAVTGLPWQAVRGDAEARAAQRVLHAALGGPADGWVAGHLLRPLSLRVTRLLVDLPVHPNHVSAAVAVIGLAGCAAIAWGDRYWLPLLGALLVQGGAVLAGCDGELARLRYQRSLAGAWLDTLGADVTAVALIMAVTTKLARFGGSFVWTGLGVAAAVSAVTAMAVTYTHLMAVGSGSTHDFPLGLQRVAPATTPGEQARVLVAALARRDAIYLACLGSAVVGLLQIAAAWLFVGAALTCYAVVRRRLELTREAAAKRATAAPAAERD